VGLRLPQQRLFWTAHVAFRHLGKCPDSLLEILVKFLRADGIGFCHYSSCRAQIFLVLALLLLSNLSLRHLVTFSVACPAILLER
jgi:hypothetical protein